MQPIMGASDQKLMPNLLAEYGSGCPHGSRSGHVHASAADRADVDAMELGSFGSPSSDPGVGPFQPSGAGATHVSCRQLISKVVTQLGVPEAKAVERTSCCSQRCACSNADCSVADRLQCSQQATEPIRTRARSAVAGLRWRSVSLCHSRRNSPSAAARIQRRTLSCGWRRKATMKLG